MKMPAQMKEDWVKALESGEYKQGYGKLHDGTGYCCLGVLQQMVDGKLEKNECYPDEVAACPSLEWYIDKGVEVGVSTGYGGKAYQRDNDLDTLFAMNDGEESWDDDDTSHYSGDKTFPEIAAWIRENIETI